MTASRITLPLAPTADDIAHLETDHNRRFAPHLLEPGNAIRNRIIMERAVIRRAAADLIAAGCWLRVLCYGGDFGCARTDNLGVVMAAIGACDNECLQVFHNSSDRHWRAVQLVYGNDGWDVISDYSLALEDLLTGSGALADQLADASAPVWSDGASSRRAEDGYCGA